jgi:hypothetical protein
MVWDRSKQTHAEYLSGVKARATAMPKASQEVLDIRSGAVKLQGDQKKQFQLADGAGQDTIAKSVAQPAQTVPAPTQPKYDYAGEINNMFDRRQSAEMDAIRKQRETALQGYNKMETQTKNQAYDNRNQADVVNMQNAQRLREAMANSGIFKSGDNITATAGLNAQRQGAIGSINRDESNQLTDIGERRNMTINNAQSDEAALISRIAADRIQAQINQRNTDRGFSLQEGGLTGNYNGQQTLAARTADRNYGLARDQYQSQEDQRGIDNQYRQDTFEYTKAQNQWENEFRNQKFDFQKAAQLWEQNFKNKSFQQGVNEFAQSLGLQQQQLNQHGQEFLVEMAYKNEALKLNQDQFEQEKFRADVADAFKRREMDFMENQPGKTEKVPTADDYISMLDKSPNLGGGMNSLNPEALETEILSLPINESEMRRLYSRYGLKWGN